MRRSTYRIMKTRHSVSWLEIEVWKHDEPKTELMTSSMRTNDPSASHVSLIALSHRMRCNQAVVLYNQKTRHTLESVGIPHITEHASCIPMAPVEDSVVNGIRDIRRNKEAVDSLSWVIHHSRSHVSFVSLCDPDA